MTQHLDALAKGAESKGLRRDLKSRLRSGEILAAADAIRDGVPWWLAKVHLGIYLRWLPNMYDKTAEFMAEEAGMSEVRELGLATGRQIAALVQVIEDRAEASRIGSGTRQVVERREQRERTEAASV
jgi:hypothetical protein